VLSLSLSLSLSPFLFLSHSLSLSLSLSRSLSFLCTHTNTQKKLLLTLVEKETERENERSKELEKRDLESAYVAVLQEENQSAKERALEVEILKKVSTLLNLLCTRTAELTFEKFDQYVAACCSVFHTTHCNTLQHTATQS